MESEEYTSRVPEFDAASILQQRLAQKSTTEPSKSSFDPHQLMVNRKAINTGEIADTTPIQTWPEEDVKKLQDFCQKMGIVGFSCGRMNPIAALAMLKKELGIPEGYEKIGEHSGYGPSYPYTEAMNKKVLLKG